MVNIVQEAVRSLEVYGVRNKREADQALRFWARRDLLSPEQRQEVVAAFDRRRHG